MQVEIRFDKPENGWWDGGAKTGGVFESSRGYKEGYTEFGAWELNHFFNVKTGRSDKETISRAKRHLIHNCHRPFQFVE